MLLVACGLFYTFRVARIHSKIIEHVRRGQTIAGRQVGGFAA
jgi:hypothetical protein